MRKDKIETRIKILNAASSLFCRVGFEGTHFDDLAEAAKVSRKTLYNHFPSKDHLLITILEPIYIEGIDLLTELQKKPFHFEDILSLFAQLWDNHECCISLLHCPKVNDLEMLKEKRENFVGMLKSAFDYLTQNGLYFPLGIETSLMLFSSIVIEVLVTLKSLTNRQRLFKEVMKGALQI